ncbi:hypothetical protein [Mucilaginibacter paludis]|uniref:Uncharacterized protein n=1 Tax=Mucilaginibacter paludis DSM 18603 TaxID=714943 RepID=H1Y6B8_9SPHI|nr:hypothetical protein [Mucilaginibacter paludis]EHQ24866.1 hypothetical protein Mucpa_0683 [Mucilaginibacter paludis DSM 18603]
MTDFIVHYTIKISSEFSKIIPGKNTPVINYSIIRTGDNLVLSEGSLTGTATSDVSEVTPDCFFIDGKLSTQLNDHEIVLKGDFKYGQKNAPTPYNRFEGTIAIYQLTDPYPKPEPPSPPEPPLPPVSEV